MNGPAALGASASAERARAIGRGIRRSRLASIGIVVLGLVGLVAALAPLLDPYDPSGMGIGGSLQAPTAAHLFGTDEYGRDVFSRVLFGARVALTVAVAVPLTAMVLGVPIGLAAGYVGGLVDTALMRAMDAVFAFPSILLGLTIVAVFGQGLTNVVVALGIVFVPQFARVTRASAFAATRENHVKAARAVGASDLHVVVHHVLPFCVSAILVQATITAAFAIVLEAALSFLGVGVEPPTPSWGVMLRNGKGFIESAWWYSVFPGLAIVATVLGFNLLGDGLRDVFDPRTRFER